MYRKLILFLLTSVCISGCFKIKDLDIIPVHKIVENGQSQKKERENGIVIEIIPEGSPASEVFPIADITSNKKKVLNIGICQIAPCVVIPTDTTDDITGFDIELWEAVAQELDITYTYLDMDFPTILKAMEGKCYDYDIGMGIAGITINAEREKLFDFSHHYLDSGLRILIRQDAKDSTWKFWEFRYLKTFGKSLVSPAVLEFIVCLFIFIFIVAHIQWLAERGKDAINDDYFPGIFESMYFCTVTSSTVGYGDITPKRWLGKIGAMGLILIGIAFFCNFTALLSADYTEDRLQGGIQGPQDLAGKVVLTKEGTTSVQYLESLGAKIKVFKRIENAYKAFLNGEGEAVVFDSPSIMYFAKNDGKDKTRIVDGIYDVQYYGFSFPQNSELREKVNRALLTLRKNGTYKKIYTKWFGEDGD